MPRFLNHRIKTEGKTIDVKILELKNIVNIMDNTIVDKDILDAIKYDFPKHKIQIWIDVLSSDIENKINIYKKVYNFGEYCFGDYKDQIFLILQENFTLYKSYASICRVFSKYYDEKYIDKNVLVIPKQLQKILRGYCKLEHEVAGSLCYIPLLVNQNFSWKYIHPSIEKMHKGEDDNVDIIYEKVTFHTHPFLTYKKKNTTVGWPSYNDYICVLSTGKYLKQPVYHIVASAEGLYVIFYDGSKMTEKWVKQTANISYDYPIDFFLKKVNTNKAMKTTLIRWGDEIAHD